MVLVLVSVANAAPELPLDPTQRSELDSAAHRVGPERQRRAGLGARVVDAPIGAVWDRILDFAAYADFYPYVTRSSLDARTTEDGHPVYVCSMNLTTKGLTTRYTLTSELHDEDGWMAFDVVPKGKGPVQAAHGWWRLEPWEGDSDRTLVTYTLTVDPDWWVPDFVGSLAARRAIPLVLDALAHRVDEAELTAKR